jgi:hypothetical protein
VLLLEKDRALVGVKRSKALRRTVFIGGLEQAHSEVDATWTDGGDRNSFR